MHVPFFSFFSIKCVWWMALVRWFFIILWYESNDFLIFIYCSHVNILLWTGESEERLLSLNFLEIHVMTKLDFAIETSHIIIFFRIRCFNFESKIGFSHWDKYFFSVFICDKKFVKWICSNKQIQTHFTQNKNVKLMWWHYISYKHLKNEKKKKKIEDKSFFW